MARISGFVIPDNKRVTIALRYIYGIGPYKSQEICDKLKIKSSMRIKDLEEKDINAIAHEVDHNYIVGGALRKKIKDDINNLISIRCYRGSRHKKGLPVRGQRTRCNARTRKGRKS